MISFLDFVTRSIPAFGGRRYIMSMGAGIVFTVLLWAGKLDQSNYVILISGTIINYVANNTYQKKQELKSQ